MTAHLDGCAPRNDVSTNKPTTLFRLRAESGGGYWLDLEIKTGARLTDLDQFLRRVWLECCGHVSGFTIERQFYSVAPSESFGGEERSMHVELSQVLPGRRSFRYDYDFGSTTAVTLRMTRSREGSPGRARVRLLAHNEPPEFSCAKCKDAATWICAYCGEDYRANPFFCDRHQKAHRCGDEAFLPVVNSPRMGVCGYSGPALG
jgi:hypothetical protein